MENVKMSRGRRAAAWFAAGAGAAGLVAVLTAPEMHPGPARVSPGPQVISAAPGYRSHSRVRYAPTELLARFQDGGLDRARIAADLGFADPLETINPDTHDVTLHLAPGIALAPALQKLKADPAVVFAEPDGAYHALYTPNDPYFDEEYDATNGRLDQWYLRKIAAPEAWDHLRKVKSTVRLAIIDTGIDDTHPDLEKIMARDSKGEPVGKNFIDNGSPRDDHGHGTHCAGIAAADTDNGVGVAGVGFHSFQLVAAKVLSEQGFGQWDWIANAITWCADNGCQVESMSLGGSGYSQAIQDAINYAWKKGVIVVAAAGNSASSQPSYPGGCSHVVGVSATDENDKLARFSNYGTPIAIGAPGVKILATMPTYECYMTRRGLKKNYDGLQGTSMACPVVSGSLAALLAYQPSLKPEEAIQRLEQTADSPNRAPNGGWEVQFGNGRVNLANAILNRHRKATVGSFYGQVVNSAGTAVSGAIVRCGGVSVTTRDDGMFRFANLKSESYTITGSGGGLQGQARASITAGCDTTVTLTLKSG